MKTTPLMLALLCAVAMTASPASEAQPRTDGQKRQFINTNVMPVSKEARTEADRQALRNLTYCRFAPGSTTVFWRIQAAALEQFTKNAESPNPPVPINFYIHKQFNNYQNPHARFDAGDYIEFDLLGPGATTLKMKHFIPGKPATPTTPAVPEKIKHEALMAKLSSDLWLEGSLVDAGAIQGTYFAYWMPKGKNCEHPNSDKSRPCNGLHIEFFDIDDTNNQLNRPRFGVNVVPAGLGNCPLGESGEGDGDEGER